jgi:hypothetical protein
MNLKPIPASAPPRPPTPPLPQNPVHGTSSAAEGVLGESNAGPGVSGRSVYWGGGIPPVEPIMGGTSDGVLGESGGNGVHGISSHSGDGVLGEGPGNGVHGKGSVQGVFGEGPNGVVGKSSTPNASGVWGENTGAGYGVSGSSVIGWGVYGSSQNGQAGLFQGKVEIIGDLTAENISGATVRCLNGLDAIGTFSLLGDATISGNLTAKGDIFLPGADCAEQFDIAEAQNLAPGTVVVIDREGTLRESWQAYDKRVAGVISGAGPYKPGIVLDKSPSPRERATVALLGKVCCKVDAQYGPVEVGDLLTTSPTPGHAMKAAEPQRAFGSVIGKALCDLEAGQGLVPILIALQ